MAASLRHLGVLPNRNETPALPSPLPPIPNPLPATTRRPSAPPPLPPAGDGPLHRRGLRAAGERRGVRAKFLHADADWERVSLRERRRPVRPCPERGVASPALSQLGGGEHLRRPPPEPERRFRPLPRVLDEQGAASAATVASAPPSRRTAASPTASSWTWTCTLVDVDGREAAAAGWLVRGSYSICSFS